MLTQAEKNNFAKVFKNTGLKFSDLSHNFSDGDERHPYGGGFAYSNRKYHFQFENRGANRFSFNSKPLLEISSYHELDAATRSYGYLIDDIYFYFSKWASALKKELETPDLWQEFKDEETINLEVFDTFKNTGPIPPEQQKMILESTNEFKTRVVAALTSKEAKEDFAQRLDQLNSRLNKLEYQEWREKFLGLILQFVLAYPEAQVVIGSMFGMIGGTVAKALLRIVQHGQ